ncbi:MAG: thioesterase family protein [Alphaproteobacteria bacterium]
MAYAAPLALFETEVRPEWIDPNGHLNVTYYVRAFDLSTDAFMDMLGIGWAYTAREKHSIFMLEAHVNYLDEVVEGDRLSFTVQLLDFDAKRIHIFQEMFHAEKRYRAATSEWLAIHVDLAAHRSVPLPAYARDKLVAIMAAHEGLSRPELAGRVMGIRRKLA